MRNSLVAALVACADRPQKPKARRFLLGLSSDELQFIAEYLGACILEADGACARNRGELAERIARVQRSRACRSTADRELKMIVLLEYMCKAGMQATPLPLRAGHSVN